MALRSFIPFCFIALFGFFQLLNPVVAEAQCVTPVTSFPYQEGFETTNGGWTTGGTASDWAWGIPAKPTINAAGGGSRCWMIGGLTNSFYNLGQQSWLRSPCFNFTNIDYPYIEFKIFWESERIYDGAELQYSINNGTSWQRLGSVNAVNNCLNQNWYNHSTSIWTGTTRPTSGSCQGGGGSGRWLVAKHTMPALSNEGSVIFRFFFKAGTTCNNFDGFAIDDVYIGDAPPNQAAFTFNCVNSRDVAFTNTSALCPIVNSWNFGDPSSGASNTSSVANPSHTFSGPGEYTVTLTVSGPDNAPSTITQRITILDASVSVIQPITCNGASSGSLLATAIGAVNTPYTYSWNTSPVQQTATATQLPAGNYAVTVSTTNGCPFTRSYTLTEPSVITSSTTTVSPSCNSSNGSATVNVSGGTAPYTYQWTPSGGTNATANNLPAGNYQVLVRDAAGCTNTASVQLSNAGAPQLSLESAINPRCFGEQTGSIAINMTGGTAPLTYSWMPNVSTTTSATNLVAGTYTFSVTDANGCTASISQTLTQPDDLTSNIELVHPTCGVNNGSIALNILGGTTPYTYNWTPSTNQTDPLTNLAAGNYQVAIVDDEGCRLTINNIVLNNRGDAASVNLGRDTSICFGESITLNAGSFDNYLWQDGSTSSSLVVTEAGRYWVRVRTAEGCIASDTIEVAVNPACNDIFFPNAFTPNNDGLNDLFGPIGNLAAVSNYRFSVFNRWGERVFFSTNPFAKWDGRVKGLKASSTLFVWQAEFSYGGAPLQVRKGTVLLIQ